MQRLLLVLFAACATPHPPPTTVQVSERLVEAWGRGEYDLSQRLVKLSTIENPYDFDVTVEVDCGWQGFETLTIEAHDKRTVLTQPQRWKAYRQTCYVTEWQRVP